MTEPRSPAEYARGQLRQVAGERDRVLSASRDLGPCGSVLAAQAAALDGIVRGWEELLARIE
jgi:hypothetical protein